MSFKSVTRMIAMTIVLGVSGAASAQFQPCVASMLQGVDATQGAQCGKWRVATIVMQRTDNLFVGYTPNNVIKKDPFTGKYMSVSASYMYFDDRSWASGGLAQNFNVNAPENIWMEIEPTTGQVKFGILAWGWSTGWITPTCSNDIILANNGLELFTVQPHELVWSGSLCG